MPWCRFQPYKQLARYVCLSDKICAQKSKLDEQRFSRSLRLYYDHFDIDSVGGRDAGVTYSMKIWIRWLPLKLLNKRNTLHTVLVIHLFIPSWVNSQTIAIPLQHVWLLESRFTPLLKLRTDTGYSCLH